MIEEDPDKDEETEAQIQHCAPIPTKWVPLFMDNPRPKAAVAQLSALVDRLTMQAEVDFYAPLIGMLETTACARDRNSSISTAAIDASRLVYKGHVKAFAERLWLEPVDDKVEDEIQDEQKDPPVTDATSNGEEESDKETSDEDNDEGHGDGAKSQQPNAVTPSKESRWQQQTAQFCAAMMKMNAQNRKSMIKAMMATTTAD
jgi:hypothetical protein